MRLLKSIFIFLIFLTSGLTFAQTDPDEITDVLERAKLKGKLVGCADPFGYPYAEQNANPPGFDVEILQAIADKYEMRVEMYWADTSSRGGMSRALRRSIMKGRCDVFLGTSDNGDEDQLMGKLKFTDPYLGLGYVLVTQGAAKGITNYDDLLKANIKVGVPMATPIDNFLFMKKIPRELYNGNRRIMQGFAKKEVDAALVWATAVSQAQREYPNQEFNMAEGYVPEKGHRWNLVMMVRKVDKSLIKFINEGIEELIKDGTIKNIVEKYGVPYYAPFSS